MKIVSLRSWTKSSKLLTLHVALKFSNVLPGDFRVDNVTLGGNLGVRGSGEGNIPVDGRLVDNLLTYTTASAPPKVVPMFPRTVVKQDLSKLLNLLKSRALGRIGIVDVVLHISVACDQRLLLHPENPVSLTQEGRDRHGSSRDTVQLCTFMICRREVLLTMAIHLDVSSRLTMLSLSIPSAAIVYVYVGGNRIGEEGRKRKKKSRILSLYEGDFTCRNTGN